jgi:hypothetical protein
MAIEPLPARITVSKACEVVGGDKPIHKTTYYRGANKGIYPRPDRADGSNISRVNTGELLAALKLNEA